MIIVDEFTGRLMAGRQWSDGLHQAVEAKEGVKIKEETQTLATITLQNFFKLYKKICGMTGTAMTEAAEFWKIYKLDVIAIPTNRPLQRIEHPDVIYRTETREVRRRRRRDRADAQVGRACVNDDGEQYRGHDHAGDRRRASSSSRRDSRTARRSLERKVERDRAPRAADAGRHRLDREERAALVDCSNNAASSTRCSTPSITSARPRSSPRPAGWAP